jgi:VIT1/CCC1 family predicted Fe2+/Mn2+ transporter
MPEQSANDPTEIKISDLEKMFQGRASVQIKIEDDTTKQTSLRRTDWQLQREKYIFYASASFTFFTAIGSVICLFVYSDASGRKTVASTLLTSILSALLGYLTGKSKSDSKD